MRKPNDWENTQAYGDFEPLELGGHICKIMKVEETKSRSGKDMINIFLDIAEGEQKGYYAEQYRKDNRSDKRWGCIVYQVLEDNNGNTHRGFKTFVTAVEKSNSGFNQNEIWDENFCEYFKNKLIGGVFGREQYINNKSKLAWSTKCVQFKDVETIKNGVPIPEDKLLEGASAPSSSNSNFADMPLDDDLPF